MAEAAALENLTQTNNSIISDNTDLSKKQDLNSVSISNGQNKTLETPTLDLNPVSNAISSNSSFDSPKRVSETTHFKVKFVSIVTLLYLLFILGIFGLSF